MSRVLLVPDLPLEHAPAIDKYAHRLHDWLESSARDFDVHLAAHIGELTRETRDGRGSGGFVRWWTQPVDPSRVVLPGPLRGPQTYAARYFFYPRRLRREAASGGSGGSVRFGAGDGLSPSVRRRLGWAVSGGVGALDRITSPVLQPRPRACARRPLRRPPPLVRLACIPAPVAPGCG